MMNHDFEQRLKKLEERIEHISKMLGVTQAKQVVVESHEPPPIPKQVQAKVTNEPTQLLPILAVICFVLAAIFVVKLTIESGWLTTERQWGLLSLAGLSLSLIGLFIEKIEKAYRSYLSAAGTIILFIAAYSSSLYFGLVSSEVSILFGALVAGFCFYQFNYFKSELFVILAVIGTYLTPILLGREADLIYLSSFFLIWAAIFSKLSIYFQNRTLTLLSSYLGLAIFTFLNMFNRDPENLLYVIAVQSLQFIIYALSVYAFSVIHKKKLSFAEANSYLPILLFFYGTIYFFLNLYNPIIAPWVSIGFALFVYFLFWNAQKTVENLESKNLIQSFLAVVMFHSGYIELVPGISKPWLLPVILLALYVSENKKLFPSLSFPLKALFSIISLLEFSRMVFNLISHSDWQTILPAFFSVILGFLYYIKGGETVKNKEGLFLSLIHVLMILSLYRLGFDYGSLTVSLLWALYSIAVLVFGMFTRRSILAKSSLVVLIITTIKALVYDASQAPTMTRIGTLVITGIVLYGSGYLFQQMNKWKN
jgi:uncharacterized membrane protein